MAGKLGRLAPKEHPRTLKLTSFLKETPTPPRVWAWEYNLPDWTMMGNDSVGDCTCACIGHMIMEWTSRTYGTVTPTTEQILAAYAAITGFDPITGAGDNGAAITDVLAYCQSTGIADHKILAWASFDPTNLTFVKQAVAIFGGIDIGFNVPQSAMDQFDAGQPWNDVGDTNIIGGHSIPVMGYGSLGNTSITWGKRQPMNWAFWKRYVDEAYAIITKDWLTQAQTTPVYGLDMVALQSALASIKA